MLVGQRKYRIVRGMFDPSGLREFEVDPPEDGSAAERVDSVDDSERHQEYVSAVVSDVGLESFAQLVFLQHFVLTFDERRHLLFWDDRVAQAAMYLAFGVDVETADRADTLRRTAERADSLARNLQWQATDVRKRLKDVEEVLANNSPVDEDLADNYMRVLGDRDEAVNRVGQLESEYSDARLRLSDRRAALHVASADYESYFIAQTSGRFPAESHPVVEAALVRSICSLCGAAGDHVGHRVRELIESHRCPLCESSLTTADSTSDNALARLGELEARVSELASEVDEAQLATTRLAEAIGPARAAADELASQVAEYERANETALLSSGVFGSAAASATESFRTQIAEFMSRKRAQLDRRNTARAELKVLQDGLTRAYASAEEEFVPLFTQLAREFLGLDLEITLQAPAAGVSLLVTIQGAARRAQESLSESQRFFVDIALRMALAQWVAGEESPACLFIDTPEGSLDIAYESRAGSMFGQYVAGGHQLIMTANINTSQLLRKLASTCGPTRMTLLRMTDWTSLSEVQSAEEQLFDDAYEQIEAALEAGG